MCCHVVPAGGGFWSVELLRHRNEISPAVHETRFVHETVNTRRVLPLFTGRGVLRRRQQNSIEMGMKTKLWTANARVACMAGWLLSGGAIACGVSFPAIAQ